MQVKKMLWISAGLYLSLYAITASAQNCEVAGVATNEVDLMDFQPKEMVCTWGVDSPAIHVTLHAGQAIHIKAICQFTPIRYDVISGVYGLDSAWIPSAHLGKNPISFTVRSDMPSPNLDFLIGLNGYNGYMSEPEPVNYTPGDKIDCTFTPVIKHI